MRKRIFLPAIFLSFFAMSARAAEQLKAGDPAPKLMVEKWLKGEPVKKFEKGKIYVIECWATWCGPCISAMPYVSKLQAKYKDKGVVVIGVNVWERDPAGAEALVKKMDDKMGYRVASDFLPITEDGSFGPGAMTTFWLQSAGISAIPATFIVDRQGKIAWMGHPMQMEHPLSLLADDKFDPSEEARFSQKMDDLNKAVFAALKAGNDDQALAALDQITALNPYIAPQFRTTRLMVLIRKGDYTAANALAAKMSADPEAVPAEIAAILLNASEQDKIDGPLALKLASKVYEENGRQGWMYQGLLAKACAVNGQFDKAVALQSKVVMQAPRQLKEKEQAALDEYRQKAAEKRR